MESDNEPESGHARKKGKEIESIASGCDVVKDLDWRFSFVESTCSLGMFMLYLAFLWLRLGVCLYLLFLNLRIFNKMIHSLEYVILLKWTH